ncbi:hypothetical protein Pfo_005274 [Paulownia fortunei]|nr:hypothetical protein Pfo_005274 [Paulownia fortunei]
MANSLQPLDVVADGKKSLTCLHCIWRGGEINRMKKHLAGRKGDIAPCKKVSYDVRYQMEQSLKECDERNQATRSFEDDNIYGPNLIELEEEMHTPHTQTKGKSKLFVGATSQKGKRKRDEKMSSYFSPRTTSSAQPFIKSAFVSKETLHNVDMVAARFFYDSCIPKNAVSSISLKYNQLRINLLGSMKKEVQLVVDGYWSIWEERSYTIMVDGWQDQSNRQLINFLVYCKRGTTFVRLVDTSDIVKNASTICNLFIKLVQWVGPINYPSITWSPCAAHCLNLIFGDIGNGAWPTCFATTFIALKSILEHQHDLQAFFSSKTFKDSRYFKDKKASFVVVVVLDTRFWSDCAMIVGVVAPLIHLLRIIDTDRRPSIGYVYDGMYRAKKAIKNIFNNKKRLYRPFTNIHASTYLLNPAFTYDKEKMYTKTEIMDGFVEMVTTLIIDKYVQRKCINKVSIFQDRLGSFNRQLAFNSSKNMQPNEWRRVFGCSAPNIQNLAINGGIKQFKISNFFMAQIDLYLTWEEAILTACEEQDHEEFDSCGL